MLDILGTVVRFRAISFSQISTGESSPAPPNLASRMKILIDHGMPFQLVHGGYQTQIEETKRGLEQIGMDVQWMRWWDDTQRADLIHAFSPVSQALLIHSREKNIPVVLTTLLTLECNFSETRIRAKRWRDGLLARSPGVRGLFKTLPQQALHLCTQNVVSLEAERRAMQRIYGIRRDRISIVPYGLSDTFLNAEAGSRGGDYLITQGTITERKNSVVLAELAHRAQVPILFVGKPYNVSDPYWKRFEALIDQKWVRHQDHVSNPVQMVELLRSARGFVLMSDMENWCLSAHEAAACGLPVLVPRMNWSMERFGDQARYFQDLRSRANLAILRRFYEDSVSLPIPQVRQWSWREVAQQLTRVYEEVLSTPPQN